MAPARCGGIRFSTSYFTLSPNSVDTSRVVKSTFVTLFDGRYSMFGYASHAFRKSAVFDTMFWFASRTISFDFGFCAFRYQAIWLMRSYGPGGQRYATGGTVRTTTPPSAIPWIARASCTV